MRWGSRAGVGEMVENGAKIQGWFFFSKNLPVGRLIGFVRILDASSNFINRIQFHKRIDGEL